jgi:hypothetical protein
LGHVARVGLPRATTSAQKPQAQASNQRKKRAPVSRRSVEFGKDHWEQKIFWVLETRRNLFSSADLEFATVSSGVGKLRASVTQRLARGEAANSKEGDLESAAP